MLTLPLEIIHHVFSFLSSDSSLAPYASVNKRWQTLVEKTTFSSLNLTPARLPDLLRFVSASSRRRSYVHKIELLAILPEYSIPARGEVETADEQRCNDESFTRAIHSLFDILSSWPDSCRLTLRIFARSPSDLNGEPDMAKRKKRLLYKRRGKDLLDLRYHHSYLRLSALEHTLPSVRAIVDLDVIGDISYSDYRRIAPAAVSGIISCLPRLRTLNGVLCDNERRDMTVKRSLRDEFAVSLTQWPASIQHLHLKYRGDPPANQNRPPPRLSEKGTDALCLALNCLSQQLVTIELEDITIGPELFWPSDAASISPPRWPHLTHFTVVYGSATTCGQWFFDRDPRSNVKNYEHQRPYEDLAEDWPDPRIPAEQDYPVDLFRTEPAPVLNELYRAAGLAAQQMPLLQQMVLVAQVRASHLECPGMTTVPQAEHWFRYLRISNLVQWVGFSEYHPTEEVLNTCRDVGKSYSLEQMKFENMGFVSCPSLLIRDYGDINFLDEYKTEDNGYVLWDKA
ncbi:hypothetical protein BJX96DRAFT_173364 [Aspergillus floccosus]